MPVKGFTVATFNLHAGVDGWGRPYDAVEGCAALDADVLVLQEDWAPAEGTGLSAEVAEECGYSLVTAVLAEGWMHPAPADAGSGFGPGSLSRRRVGLRLDSSLATRSGRRSGRSREPIPSGSHRGAWQLAVLSRLPVLDRRRVELEHLKRDPARRFALWVDLDWCGVRITVVGVHMSHLSQGSLIQFGQLRRTLPKTPHPVVVAGDMNLWGPPLRLLLPGWREAVRGRTWPAWRPVAQTDHILTNDGILEAEGEMRRLGSSDHLAVRARLLPDVQPAINHPLVGG